MRIETKKKYFVLRTFHYLIRKLVCILVECFANCRKTFVARDKRYSLNSFRRASCSVIRPVLQPLRDRVGENTFEKTSMTLRNLTKYDFLRRSIQVFALRNVRFYSSTSFRIFSRYSKHLRQRKRVCLYTRKKI